MQRSKQLILFCLMMLFVFLADGMMSYLSPVLIQARVHNTLFMGLILSSSSVFGLIADMFLSRLFVKKEYQFFSRWLLGLALFFPLSFLVLPSEPLLFLLAMAIWGIYYEFITFSEFNFLAKTVGKTQHPSAWGVLGAFKSLGLLLAPLLATILLEMHHTYPLLLVIGFLLVAMVMFFTLRSTTKKPKDTPTPDKNEVLPSQAPRSLVTQLKIWFTLIYKVWPVYLFFFAFIVLETSFWSVGPLVMEELRHKHLLGGMLLSFYVAPSFFVPLYVHRFGKFFGKKRTAFVSAAIGATLLAIGGLFFSDEWYFPLIVLASALFLSLDYPSIEAVFEDYMSRIHDYGNDLVGLRGTAASLAYIVGPTAAGALALTMGGGKTIGIFAAVLAVISLILLAVTPRKIKMPQGELEETVL